MATERTRQTGDFIALIVAAMLALCLAGCGGQQASSSSASESASETAEQAAGSGATADGVPVPEDIAVISGTVKGVVESGDTEGADGIDSLPKAEAAEGENLEASEIAVGADDDSKYSGDLALFRQGGIQMVVPSDWLAAAQEDGMVLTNPAGDVVCLVSSYPKSDGETVPLEQLAEVTPVQLSNKGLSDVQVINYGTDYSSTGTLCTSFVFCQGTLDGTEYLVYDQFVDSKHYVNLVEFVAPSKAFKASFDEIKTMTKSLYFNPGEEI